MQVNKTSKLSWEFSSVGWDGRGICSSGRGRC